MRNVGDTWIVDITHYLEPDGSVPEGPFRRIASYFGSIVSAASLQPAGEWLDAAIRCRRRPGRRPCPGHIRVRRVDLPSRVEWHCTFCGDNGLISHWRGTRWDLNPLHKGAPTGAVLEVRLSAEELAELRGIFILSPESRTIVHTAPLASGGAVLRGSLDDLEELAEYIAAEAIDEPAGTRQMVLHRVLDKLEAVIDVRGG